MKKKIMLITALLCGATTAYAGDIEAGKAKSMVCAACHGQDGIAVIDGYPNLRGQNEKYLLSALHAYKDKLRTSGNAQIMQVQAMILSNDDMENVAAYYSSLK